MPSLKDQLKPNPGDFTCPHCKVEMQKRMSMTGGGAELRKGLIMVCSACANVSVLGDNSLHPMTKAEFDALEMPTKAALARCALEIKKRGGEWNPYSGNGKK